MYHQEGKIKKSKSSYIGSILLIISALLPCLDVISVWIRPELKGMLDSTGTKITVDIWLATLYISPAIILLAVSFKPNPRLYFFPLFMFFYTGLVYFSPVYGNKIDFLKFNSWLTAILSAAAVLIYMFILKYVRRLTLLEDNNDSFMDDVKEELTKLNLENKSLKEKLKKQDGN